MRAKDTRNALKVVCERILMPFVVLLNKTGITPNAITWLGFAFNLAAAVMVAKGFFLIAGLVMIAGNTLDMVDGIMARNFNKKTKFGGFLDSSVDRLSEGVLFFGIIFYYTKTAPVNINGIIFAYLGMLFSFLVSYLRSRAGALSIECDVGIFTRPERVVTLIIGLLINQLFAVVVIITVFSAITFIQRFNLAYDQANIIDRKRSERRQ